MVTEGRIVKSDQVGELGQVLLDDHRIVLPKEVVQVLRDESGQACVRQRYK